jgi:RNA polymerase sigma-70 factor (ECF subfamily)
MTSWTGQAPVPTGRIAVSDQGSGGDTTADAIAKQARARQGRDKELVEASREGDRNAFGKLYDSWVDHVYDRAVNSGASAAEAREVTEQTFLTVWHNLGRLRQPAAIGAKILQVAQRQATTHVRSAGPPASPAVKLGEAEDRLTRTTDAANAAADPDVAAVLRDASLALDDRTRSVLDLHFRQGLTPGEVGAVLGIEADAVRETIAKLPTALGVLTRARVLWRGGRPLDDELAVVLEEEHITSFDASTVRTINRFAKDHDRARARSMIAVAPIELYAAIPLATAPAGLKMAVAELLVTEGVPMDGSAFVKRDDRGEILAKPKAKRADLNAPNAESRARPAPPMGPNLDKQKVAAVAAAALAAEAVAVAAEAEGATTLEPPPDDDKKSRVSERFRARKATPGPAPVAAAGAAGAALVGTADADADAPEVAPVDHGPSGDGAGEDAANGTGDRSIPVGPPLLGPGGLSALDAPPSADDLDARAEGEAAAMGRAYTRPGSLDGGGARTIPGAAHLDRDDGPNRKKALMIGGAVAAAVVLFGGAAFAMRGSGDETKTAAGGPRPTNPADPSGAGAVTTTLPATTTTAVIVTTEPAPTTTAAPETGGEGSDLVTSPTAPAPTTGGAPTGGGNPPSNGGAPVTTTAPPPVTANIAQSVQGGSTWGTSDTNRPVDYAMATAPVLSWDLASSGPFTVSIYNGGEKLGEGLPAAGSLPICPTNNVRDGACLVSANTYGISVVVFGSDGSVGTYRVMPFTVA